jgi:hypothetical protein
MQKTLKSRVMVVDLDWLATYHGVAGVSILQEGGGNSGGRIITAEYTDPKRRRR